MQLRAISLVAFTFACSAADPIVAADDAEPTDDAASDAGIFEAAVDVQAKPDAPPPTPGGKLDPTFSTGTAPAFVDVAVQSDGKILVATQTDLQRRLPDGSLDTTFGTKGIATPIAGDVRAIALLPSGKIATFGAGAVSGSYLLTELSSAGVLLGTVAMNGKSNDKRASVTASATGNLAVGASFVSDYFVNEYDGTGKLTNHYVPSFGSGAIVDDVAYDGSALLVVGHTSATVIARYDNGAIDTTFGTSGYATVSFSSLGQGWGDGCQIARSSSGYVVRCTLLNSGNDAVARLSLKGVLDTTFGKNGMVVVTGAMPGLAIDGSDRILLGAAGAQKGVIDLGALRLLPSGAIDTYFGANGYATTSFGENAFTNAIALQPDGKIVVVGNTNAPAGVAARFEP